MKRNRRRNEVSVYPKQRLSVMFSLLYLLTTVIWLTCLTSACEQEPTSQPAITNFTFQPDWDKVKYND